MEKKRLPLEFPIGGINRRFDYDSQPEQTTPDALNVRPESIWGQRYRGGTRPGQDKVYADPIGSRTLGITTPAAINCLEYVSWSNNAGTVTHQLVAAAGGALWRDVSGTMTHISNSALGTSYTQGVDILEKLYFPDYSGTGGTVKVYDPLNNTIGALVATAGSIPTDCKICCRFRGRLILAGDPNDPHQYYASRVLDPSDFDYSIEDDTAAAFSGTLADAAKVGETITAIIPGKDLCILFGCTNSLWLMRGDPLFGGQLDNLSQTIGIIDMGAWCRTPEGGIVFLSYDGLYFSEGTCGSASVPQSLSKERIPEELIGIDTSTTLALLEYDTKSRGVHIYLSPKSGNTAGTHWYFDWQHKGFWKVQLPGNLQPRSIRIARAVSSSQSVVYHGGIDGFIRHYDTTATDDDGTAIASYLDIGPFGQGAGFQASCVDQLQCTMAEDGGPVEWSLRTGNSTEAAYNASKVNGQVSRQGRWTSLGWNHVDHPRLSGSDFFLNVSSLSEQWALERMSVVLSTRGRVRG